MKDKKNTAGVQRNTSLAAFQTFSSHGTSDSALMRLRSEPIPNDTITFVSLRKALAPMIHARLATLAMGSGQLHIRDVGGLVLRKLLNVGSISELEDFLRTLRDNARIAALILDRYKELRRDRYILDPSEFKAVIDSQWTELLSTTMLAGTGKLDNDLVQAMCLWSGSDKYHLRLETTSDEKSNLFCIFSKLYKELLVAVASPEPAAGGGGPTVMSTSQIIGYILTLDKLFQLCMDPEGWISFFPVTDPRGGASANMSRIRAYQTLASMSYQMLLSSNIVQVHLLRREREAYSAWIGTMPILNSVTERQVDEFVLEADGLGIGKLTKELLTSIKSQVTESNPYVKPKDYLSTEISGLLAGVAIGQAIQVTATVISKNLSARKGAEEFKSIVSDPTLRMLTLGLPVGMHSFFNDSAVIMTIQNSYEKTLTALTFLPKPITEIFPTSELNATLPNSVREHALPIFSVLRPFPTGTDLRSLSLTGTGAELVPSNQGIPLCALARQIFHNTYPFRFFLGSVHPLIGSGYPGYFNTYQGHHLSTNLGHRYSSLIPAALADGDYQTSLHSLSNKEVFTELLIRLTGATRTYLEAVVADSYNLKYLATYISSFALIFRAKSSDAREAMSKLVADFSGSADDISKLRSAVSSHLELVSGFGHPYGVDYKDLASFATVGTILRSDLAPELFFLPLVSIPVPTNVISPAKTDQQTKDFSYFLGGKEVSSAYKGLTETTFLSPGLMTNYTLLDRQAKPGGKNGSSAPSSADIRQEISMIGSIPYILTNSLAFHFPCPAFQAMNSNNSIEAITASLGEAKTSIATTLRITSGTPEDQTTFETSKQSTCMPVLSVRDIYLTDSVVLADSLRPVLPATASGVGVSASPMVITELKIDSDSPRTIFLTLPAIAKRIGDISAQGQSDATKSSAAAVNALEQKMQEQLSGGSTTSSNGTGNEGKETK